MSRASKLIIFSIAFIVIIIGSIFISGCQSQPNNDASFNDELPMDRRIGELKSLGGILTESQGTHILQLDNGDTILLKSVAINLDDEKYVGKTLEVRGVLTYTNDDKFLMEVMNIDILEQFEAKEATKAKWMTYSNSDFNFSVKYRSDFDVKENNSGVVFSIPESKKENAQPSTSDNENEVDTADVSVEIPKEVVHLVSISTKSKEEDEDLNSYLKIASDSSEDMLSAGYTQSKVGGDNLKAYKEETMDGAGLSFYLENDDHIYTVSFEAGSDGSFTDAQNLFYEMLGTFKIKGIDQPKVESENVESDNVADDSNKVINEEDKVADGDESMDEQEPVDETEVADGFNVFENETFEFSVQYPKNWYYSGLASSENGVVRRYEFGDDPTEEKPGNVYLDVYSGDIPDGTSIDSGDYAITKVSTGSGVELYIEGNDRKIRISGPSSLESTLMQMAKSVE